MRARVFLLLCALAFAAATLAFVGVSMLEGRGVGGLLPAALFSAAFLLVAARLPERDDACCARCGRARDVSLAFCGRCGEARQ